MSNKPIDIENATLMALAKEHAEARRPVTTLIVMAACNAKTSAQQDKTLVALASLKRQGLVVQHCDRWEVTADGHIAARQLMAQETLPQPGAEPIPMERGFKSRKVRDTIRPMIGGAPKPVTRSVPAPTIKESLSVAPGPGPSSTACDDQWQEERIDVIGQNGPTGEHYPANDLNEYPSDAEVEQFFGWLESCPLGGGKSQPSDPFAEFTRPFDEADSLFKAAQRDAVIHALGEAGLAVLQRDLLDRCAAMHLTLLAQAKAARDAGDPGAGRELAWLLETGEQLVAAGRLA
ncbi:hypothetical protein F0A17_01820 [Billgrantia pellis]|uniref:Uncharacterized protein n=1 Tax=Billgrantia pellis TaxID=2606936 RepID=A0A7V7G314_9GAMM|nr:hypothetical protein [Halomonas pellis]KAA0014412.1 hypothetical protein F0A17_01820 [Halomonas pellis]